jgi:hypothetical protein
MAQERPATVSRRRAEQGAALILVLLALAALTPLALMLSEFVLTRQRQTGAYQHALGSQAAVRGALDVALGRLASGDLALDPAQTTEVELEPGPRPIRLRVSREGDVILGLDGGVTPAEDAAALGIDVGRMGIDPVGGGTVREYRLMEVYRVEAECPARYPFPAVRLLAAVGRLDGTVVTLGVRYDRGYFP